MIKCKGKVKKHCILFLLVLLLGCLCTIQPVYAKGSCTLSVRNGEDITVKLKKAIKKYDTIRIPGGTYRVSGSLTLDNKTAIKATSGRVVLALLWAVRERGDSYLDGLCFLLQLNHVVVCAVFI